MLILLALAAAAATPASAAPQVHALPLCKDVTPTPVEGDNSARLRKLNELPNANLYLGVIRKEDGCSKPAIVRYDIGGAPRGR
jgi:hypothetical protein